MTASLSDLNFKIGQSNGSGIANVFVAAKEWISAWPSIDDDLDEATDLESYTTYTGNFTMATDKTFIRAYQVQGEGSMDVETTGETDSKMFNNSIEFRFPKLSIENLALQKALVNGDCVVVAWHDGAYRVVGHKYYRSVVEITSTTGKEAGSSKGSTYKVTAPDYAALPIYVGNLPLPDGSLNCSTDVFTPNA